MESKTIILSGFPGIGKTYVKNTYKDKIKIADLDSSKYSKLPDGSRNPNFKEEYLNAIKSLIDEKYDIILVSTYKETREILQENNIGYILIFPNIKLKDYYMELYKNRGNNENFIKLLKDNWDNWINELMEDKDSEYKIIINENKYLLDYIEDLLK